MLVVFKVDDIFNRIFITIILYVIINAKEYMSL